MNGAELLIKLLQKEGIDTIAGIPGGANLPIYDALYASNIKHVLVRHEQAAGFIAQGISRTTGKVGVCFATSGPGATNILTAIADAKLDSIPIITITGQVPYSLIGTDAFQEVDTYGLTVPITKHNFLVRDAKELAVVIPQAFKFALEGRPGPIVIDIPKNVQLQQVTEAEIEDYTKNLPTLESSNNAQICDNCVVLDLNHSPEDIINASKMINDSKKPILYVGGGVIASNSSKQIYDLAKKNNIPTTLTLMGLGAFPPEDNLYLGMLGMHGSRYTNFLMKEADLIIALGVRFDDRATGNIGQFCPNAKIIHIDIDSAEINKVKSSNIFLVGDLNTILSDIIKNIESNNRVEWLDQLNEYRAKYPFKLPDSKDTFHPLNIIAKVRDILNDDDIVSTDVGQHQMWTAQGYKVTMPRTFLTSGGLGTMGFGMPTAIGAALANPDKTVVCFSGDGSILMNIQEFATLADLQPNLKVIIMNNGHLGLVRQQQEMFYNQHYIASKFDTSPDFAQIAKGFGIKGYTISNNDDIDSLLEKYLAEPGPVIIDIMICPTENVLPIVPPGKANYEMQGGE